MKLRYPSGQLVTANVVDTLRYIAKVGALSKNTWVNYFAKGNYRWKNRQLQFLNRNRILKLHSCERLKETWVLDINGKRLLDDMQQMYVTPIFANNLDHDEIVANGVLSLERSNICQKWFTEKELKLIKGKQVEQTTNCETKYPDAMLQIETPNKKRVVAIEYEKHGKDYGRYRSILWRYLGMKDIDHIFYVVEDKAIERRIMSVTKKIASIDLINKLGFINVTDWKRNAIEANIKINNGKTNFIKICKC